MTTHPHLLGTGRPLGRTPLALPTGASSHVSLSIAATCGARKGTPERGMPKGTGPAERAKPRAAASACDTEVGNLQLAREPGRRTAGAADGATPGRTGEPYGLRMLPLHCVQQRPHCSRQSHPGLRANASGCPAHRLRRQPRLKRKAETGRPGAPGGRGSVRSGVRPLCRHRERKEPAVRLPVVSSRAAADGPAAAR